MSVAENFSDILKSYPDAKLIKKGGQKVVFLIHHPEYGACVLKAGTFSHESTIRRIIREVQTLKEIDSPYFPKHYEFILLDSQRFIIFEEYIESKTLSALLNQYQNPQKALLLIIEIVNGLKILWDKQIVHRDLKPDNILIISNGMPKIIDLGIARILNETSLTETLAMRGPATPIYAAPEQLQNRKNDIDIRTDQFNLGIILVQLLLGGTHPFDPKIAGGEGDIVDNILANNWYRDQLNSPELNEIQIISNKLLGKEPYLRYRTPEYLLNALSSALRNLHYVN